MCYKALDRSVAESQLADVSEELDRELFIPPVPPAIGLGFDPNNIPNDLDKPE